MAKDEGDKQGLPEELKSQAIEAQLIPTGLIQEQQGKKSPGRQRGIDDSFTGRAAQLGGGGIAAAPL